MQPSLLLGRDTHRELIELLKKERRLVLSGASNETAKALLLSLFLEQRPQRTLLLTGRAEEAETLQHWLQFFEQETHILQPIENDEGEVLPDALQVFLQLMQGEEFANGVFLCARETWDQSFPRFAELTERTLTLAVGKEIHFTTFIEDLIERGYRHGEDLYLSPGEYRRIGDVFDIFPIQSTHPYRISFDVDRVEKILTVDPVDLSQTKEGGKELQIFPLLYERMATLSEQLPTDVLLVVDDQDDVEFPLTTTALRFTPFPETDDHHAHLRYLSVLKFYTLTDFLNDVRDKLTQKWAIFVVTKRLDELESICKEEHIPCTTEHRHSPGTLTLIGAEDDELLPHSLQNPDLKFALLTDREIFSLKKAGKQRSIQKLALDFITSLVPGDYVVHMEHGIGHFEGMTQKEVDGTNREYLELTYAEGDKLFVPVDQADKLSKFVYEEGQEPILTRLGTNEWKRVMKKTQEETEQIAKELLLLYAKRAKAKGFGFDEDSDVQRKFEESFPYEETPGQRKAIEDLKNDMEGPHPMDRLICGDVGFGKTEVAMRAAFKAVQGGKQVAVVAPITILADQHYHNFRDRMSSFNVRVEMLSRFRTARQQKETLDKLKKGEVDIVIGTHRLLQDDVKFHNLGLVIVDEEQRFGVKQKEKFKDMRASVDILTLTATPIPRTLNLGLHKLRDITTITTPPPGRLPIITEVRRYSDSLIRHAIIFELKRNGQIFVLHNRVETIDAFADKLRTLTPEAKFIVAHGQLKAEDLESRVLQFKEGKVDVLVSSTIIENGIDLPRANTLVIDEAEHFGLAQLYQLRGRVGRSKVQAYAYFLYHGQRLKDDAKKRLRAIVEACELGSGFQVAMRDLEIRGAGEILGASQSGTMNTVGVSHYLRMLKAAVEELKAGDKSEIEEEISPEILLPVEAILPSFYITDEQERISVYQKLAGSEDEATLKEFEEDLYDEYGEPPQQVKNLLAVLRLKLVCRHAGVLRIKMEHEARQDFLVLTLAGRVTAKEIMQLIKEHPQWKISGSTLNLPSAELAKKAGEDGSKWMAELTKQVRILAGKAKEKN
ncbi:transcription-repair coupling factor [Candidatus Peregrinibacteria bacterium CG1_02_54_53]|nr:MAG: transcription-repair coupling factor [Candidatus Peregrinibacteria bacterium CG1_02_54_53]